jgi:hypothetical protein
MTVFPVIPSGPTPKGRRSRGTSSCQYANRIGPLCLGDGVDANRVVAADDAVTRKEASAPSFLGAVPQFVGLVVVNHRSGRGRHVCGWSRPVSGLGSDRAGTRETDNRGSKRHKGKNLHGYLLSYKANGGAAPRFLYFRSDESDAQTIGHDMPWQSQQRFEEYTGMVLIQSQPAPRSIVRWRASTAITLHIEPPQLARHQ